MAWTTFAALGVGPGTTPELDANFNVLSALVPIPCSVSGTNALVLTSIEGAGSVAAYANYMTFIGIAAATNSGATTANPLGLGALPVYKDTATGPVALVGGEIVQNCRFQLTYDATLNSNAGGFHLGGGGNALIGTTVSATSILLGSGSVSGLFSVGTIIAPSGSVSGLFSGASISVAAGDALVRLNSTLGTVTIASALTPQTSSLHTIALAGAAINDSIIVGLPSLSGAQINGIYNAFVSASGSVVLDVYNPATAATIAATTLVFRLTNMGFVT